MEFLKNPWVIRIARAVLGCVLIYASWHKIGDPPDFAKIILNYHMFPASWIHALAIFVPWIELVAGLALLTGIGARGGALMAILFFTSFIAFLSINLARECPTICGCFDTHASGQSLTAEEKFWEMKKEIGLDFLLVVLAVYAFWGSTRLARRQEADLEPVV